jgi:hypothetical protein
MIRNLKTFGLALVSIIAVGATVVQAASAHEFVSESSSTIMTASQVGESVFTAEGNEVKCTAAKFTGTQSGTEADEVQVHPTYGAAAQEGGSCKFSALTATVNTGSCDYRFDSETDANGDVTTKIVCASGSITVSLSGCTLTIGAQTVDGGASFENEGSGSTTQRRESITATGIDYSASGFGCSLAGIKTGAHSDGTYSGTTIVTCTTTATVHTGCIVR